MSELESYTQFLPGSSELVNQLVQDHQGWAISIAKNVARSWNMDFELDGLDGGALEGLLFCAQRFDPKMGVPFRAYARRRIHESATEEARKSRNWKLGTASNYSEDDEGREISAKLFDIFPTLREGILPSAGEGVAGNEALRSSIKQLLAGATILAAFNESSKDNPENILDIKRLVAVIQELEIVHQSILWNVYWCGQSLRSIAEEWGIDELAVIREHKDILTFISTKFTKGKNSIVKKPEIRRSLKEISIKLKDKFAASPFKSILQIVLLVIIIGQYL